MFGERTTDRADFRPWRPGTITQAELADYLRLVAAARRRDAVRADLVDRLAAGGRVEAGPLTAAVVEVETRRLTIGRLAAVIGEPAVRAYQARIEPAVSRRLDVGPPRLVASFD